MRCLGLGSITDCITHFARLSVAAPQHSNILVQNVPARRQQNAFCRYCYTKILKWSTYAAAWAQQVASSIS
jgi:hypothetical protein